MKLPSALLVAAAATCIFARPPDLTGYFEAVRASRRALGGMNEPVLRPPFPALLGSYLPRLLQPAKPTSAYEWLSKEIDRINMMGPDEEPDIYIKRRFMPAMPLMGGFDTRYMESLPEPQEENEDSINKEVLPKRDNTRREGERGKHIFAYTPREEGFFSNRHSEKTALDVVAKPLKKTPTEEQVLKPARQIRQNPTLSKSKTLIADSSDNMGLGGSSEEIATDAHRVLVLSPNSTDYFYHTALVVAGAVALAFTVVGFLFGWYTLSKKAKAAEDVDYPAYGVTGPAIDMSGDRKLAQSAHMYHYQHHKQQILAMERNGNGSVSDPESEEENEEGDYTVYECPGFATTGDMEVKNPMFSEDPTPATPGKYEIYKPQPKN